MWTSLLIDAIPWLTGGGGAMLSWYIRGSMGKNRDPKPTKPKEQTLVEVVKAGWDATDKMAREIHDMYHPVGCKCAMCEIKRDDKEPEADPGNRCAVPCFGCTVLTCKNHPDNPTKPINFKPKLVQHAPGDKPNACCLRGFPDAAPGDHWECPDCGDDWQAKAHGDLDISWRRMSGRYRGDEPHSDVFLRQQVKNLESQLNTISKAYRELLEGRELVSAGMHLGGRPLYMLSTRAEFKPNPKAGDRENMRALAEHEKIKSLAKECTDQELHDILDLLADTRIQSPAATFRPGAQF